MQRFVYILLFAWRLLTLLQNAEKDSDSYGLSCDKLAHSEEEISITIICLFTVVYDVISECNTMNKLY